MRFQSTNLQTVSGWVGRILRLDLSAFDEIRADPTATSSAFVVVGGASVLAGIGSWVWALQADPVDSGEVLVKSLVLGSILQTLAWLLWVYLAYQVLTHAYGTRLVIHDLARSMGFAFAPVGLSILIAIQALAVPFGVVSLGMAFLLTNYAIERTAGIETQQAMLANVTGFTVFAIVMGILVNLFEVGTLGGLAPGLFFFSLDLF